MIQSPGYNQVWMSQCSPRGNGAHRVLSIPHEYELFPVLPGRDLRAGLRVFWSHKPQQREQAPWKLSGAELFGGWEVFDYLHLFLWKLLGAAEGKRKYKQRRRQWLPHQIVDGELPSRLPRAPHRFGPRSVAGVIKCYEHTESRMEPQKRNQDFMPLGFVQ